MFSVRRIAAVPMFAIALACISPAYAQNSSANGSSFAAGFLHGRWKVTVEGETRGRELSIFQERGSVRVAASYGWADRELDAVKAAASINNEKMQLELLTPASSEIKAEQQDARTLTGTFRRGSTSKPVTITRMSDDGARSESSFAEEDTDFQVQATKELASGDYHRPTPLEVPGAKTLKTMELWALLTSAEPPAVIDVLDGKAGVRTTIPTAVWVGSRFGSGPSSEADRKSFADMLAALTGGRKAAPVVFLCLDSRCWLSYNASLRAVQESYSNVYWYRGGWRAWRSAKLPMVFAEPWTR